MHKLVPELLPANTSSTTAPEVEAFGPERSPGPQEIEEMLDYLADAKIPMMTILLRPLAVTDCTIHVSPIKAHGLKSPIPGDADIVQLDF